MLIFPSNAMRLCHPPDGITNPKYKLQCFITTKFFCKEKNALAFNWDRCCHLALCLQLIPFHCRSKVWCLLYLSSMHLCPPPPHKKDFSFHTEINLNLLQLSIFLELSYVSLRFDQTKKMTWCFVQRWVCWTKVRD